MECHEVGSGGHDFTFIAFHIHLQGTQGEWTEIVQQQTHPAREGELTNSDTT